MSCETPKIHSIVQVPKQVLILYLFCGTKYLHYRSRNSGSEFDRGTNPFNRSVFTPVSCTKHRIHSVMKTVLVLRQVLIFHFFVGPNLCFTDQETQEEIFGGTSSLLGQFLHPSPVQSSRSIQCMNTVKVDEQVLILLWETKSLHYKSRNSGRDFG